MAERRDYVALEWVKGEIFDTLKQARQALEAFVDTPEDTTRLQFSLAYIHQVNGTLQMVEFFGAALLAEEMERLNQSIVDGDIPPSQDNLALLMQAILQLPNYLEKLKRGQSDLPVVILPLLNDLRAARGEPLLSETALFTPDLSASRRFVGEPDTQSIGQSSVVQLLRKLRQMYQLALLGWLRNEDTDNNLEYLGKSVHRLVGLTERTPMGSLWQVADAFIGAIKAGRIERSAAITVILRHLDGAMKRLLADPVGVAGQYPHEDQLKNLLYYLAKIDASGLSRVQHIQDSYHLSQALPDEAEIETQRQRLSGPDRETVGSVVSALLEELARLKDSLDLMVRTRVTESRRLSELEPGIKQMADTMAVLGLGNPRRVLNEQLDLIKTTQQEPELKDDGVLMDIAGALLYVEASLSGIASDASFDRDEYDDGLDGAQEAVVREARNGLEQVKDAIVEFIGSHWDHSKLEAVPRDLSGIRGGLTMIPLEQAATVLKYAQDYVEDQLLGNKRTPEWNELDALADAIMGVEYYLERLSRDGSGTNLDILQRAADSIAKLGYTINLFPEADSAAEPDAEEPVETDKDDFPDLSLQELELGDSGDLEDDADVELDIEATDDFETLTDWDDDIEARPVSDQSPTDDGESSDWLALDTETDPSETGDESSADIDDPERAGESSPTVAETAEAADDDLIDDDILEIFIEEAAEVLETIHEFFPRYKADPSDSAALTEFRRAFHTLKGSGRMVGATVVGETAWSIENMLNRLIEGSITHSNDLVRVIEEITDEVPALMTAFEKKLKPDTARADYLAAIANALAKGESVSWGEASPESPASSEPSDVDVDIELPQSEVAETPDDDSDWSDFDELPVAEVEETDLDDLDTANFDIESSDSSTDTLLEIFQAELASHLEYIDHYIDEAAASSLLPDSLQRALHTIKGSAHMASVEPVAELVQPLEQLVRDMQERSKVADPGFLTVLTDGVALIRHASKGDPVDTGAFEAKVQDVYNRVLRLDPSQEPDDPALMSIFMSDSMDLVLGAETILKRWQDAGEPDADVNALIRELNTLALASQSVDLLPVADLSHNLGLLVEGARSEACDADERFFELANTGLESLISMMDRLAAGQSIRQDALFVERLHQLLPDAENTPLEPADSSKNQVGSMIRQDLESSEAGVVEPEQVAMPEFEAAQRYRVEGDAELVDIFLEEANDILDSIQSSLEKWREDTNNTLEVESLQRDLHTLKGGARMAEISPLGDLAHELEFLYEGLAQGKYQASDGLLELIQQCHDRLAVMVQDIESSMSCESAPDLVAAINHFRKHPGAPARPVDMTQVSRQENPVSEQETPVPESKPVEAPHSDADPIDSDEKLPEPAPAAELAADVDLDILEIFIDEAGELLNELEQAIEDWQAEPGNETHADEMKRVLHTLKGGARLARLKDLGDQSHEFETFIVRAQQNKDALDEVFFNNILARQDQLVQGVEAMNTLLDGHANSGAGFGPSVIQMARDLEEDGWDDPDQVEVTTGIGQSEPDTSATTELATSADTEPASDAGEVSTNVLPFKRKEAERKADNRRAQPQETVKVNANLLEGLVNLAGETSIARARLEQEVSDFGFTLGEMDSTIDRLREQVRRLDMETEAQILFRQERAEETNYEDFDPLEMDRYSQIQQLSRSLMEATYDLTELKGSLTDKTRDAETLLLQQSRINTELQEGLMQTRMVPFNRLVPRLRRIVRQVAGELGKQVDFIVGNAEGEVDRTVLERMISPLEHMLRNAVDHGIEDADQRLQSGKTVKGSVRLDLSREGGDIVLRLSDDGAGMNVDRIRSKAIERGLMAADADLNDREILQYILEAGFSTAEKVTQISGRGVGMDVVNSEVKQLGGNMAIDARLGEGSQFTIRLPFTVSVNRALMVNIEEDHYAIPLSSIEGIVRVTPKQLAEYYRPDAPLFEYAGGRYRLEYMGGLLRTGATPNVEGLTAPVPLVLVKGSDEHHSMALHVDRLMGSREIVVKTLGPQFSTVPGVSGATILGDGSVVVILDLAALIRSSLAIEHSRVTTLPTPKTALAATKKPVRDKDSPYTVMVVDDSVTVRKVTSRLLERQGMEVILAKHGADAVAQLQDRVPDIMLLDIEMPYMDGFEVASRVRHDSRLKQIPIIMITSRTGAKHRERALSIGVNEYMGKPFQEGPLVDAIKRLLGIEA
ncbi:Hpt domain-containing protein [Saccharospirillum impatiens]|uniref:Hpt domain-containing protein n=1 Tax=Saccharospirillum impatiens TaxID=169438 RepID=UPI0003F837A9|nr:Hpt domain-containing protein [Saccharospirillum impatiens]